MMNQINRITWLLEGDPAIRWQVMRDLMAEGEAAVNCERQRVAMEGWGARLLACQDASGRWSGELYNQKWLSTTYTLLLLRQMGLPVGQPQALAGCRELLEGGFRPGGAISYARNPHTVDIGVMGMVCSVLAYFDFADARTETVVDYLLGQQLPDGRWEPVADNPQIRYAFDTTLLVLEGLNQAEKRYPARAIELAAAQARGREFLLAHRLYKTMDPEQVMDAKMTLFSFPPRWHYDVLAALDYFQNCRAERDERFKDAVDLLIAKRNPDGTWNLQNRHAGKTYFEMEAVGKASRWNTLRALRVIKWWQGEPA